MFQTRPQKVLIAATVLGLTLTVGASLALADATLERRTRMSGFAGLGPGETTSVEKISGLRKRETANVKMSGDTGTLPADQATDRITDVQQGLVWRFDHERNSYSEGKIKPPPTGRSAGGGTARANPERPGVQVLRNEITVRETGEKKTISVYECTHYVVSWVTVTEDSSTKERAESTWVADLWNTPETPEIKALQKEERKYQEAWLKKIGWGTAMLDVEKLGLSAGMGMQFGGDDRFRKSALAAGANIHGYTIATGTRWNMKSSGGDKAAAASAPEGSGPKITRGLSGFMAGLDKGDSSGTDDGLVFESYSEIERISTADLPQSDFALPEDYKNTYR